MLRLLYLLNLHYRMMRVGDEATYRLLLCSNISLLNKQK